MIKHNWCARFSADVLIAVPKIYKKIKPIFINFFKIITAPQNYLNDLSDYIFNKYFQSHKFSSVSAIGLLLILIIDLSISEMFILFGSYDYLISGFSLNFKKLCYQIGTSIFVSNRLFLSIIVAIFALAFLAYLIYKTITIISRPLKRYLVNVRDAKLQKEFHQKE